MAGQLRGTVPQLTTGGKAVSSKSKPTGSRKPIQGSMGTGKKKTACDY